MTSHAADPVTDHAVASNQVVTIPVAAVTWRERSKAERSFDPAFAHKLAESIRREGLHHPIQVKAVPGCPGRYEGVAGRHRHFAVADVLGLAEIEAKVLADWQVAIASQMEISENLFRSPLNKGQEALAIRTWHECFTAEHAAEEQDDMAGPDGEQSHAPVALPDPPSRDRKPRAKNFARHVAETTGRSETAIKRSLAIGRAFTADQLEVFTRQGTRQVWMETIAKKEPEVRDAVVALIADGQAPSQALEEVTEATHEQLANGRLVLLSEVQDADELFDHELSDDQWLDAHCSALMDSLADATRFRDDALSYRRNVSLMTACRQGIGKNSWEHVGLVKLGFNSFHERLVRALSVAHPKDWRRCDACEGGGLARHVQAKAGAPCPTCSGGGYAVTQESH